MGLSNQLNSRGKDRRSAPPQAMDLSRIGISTWVYFWRPLREVLKDIAKAGYTNVEIWADKTHLDPRISPDIPALKDLLNRLHLKVHSLHAPFSGVDIASLDEGERKSSLKLIKKSIEFCSGIAGKMVIVHPAFRKKAPASEESYLKVRNKTEDSLCTLATFAEKLGIRVAVENMTGKNRVGSDIPDLTKLVSKINSPHLGLCLDIGHVFVGRENVDLSKAVFACGESLIALHIQDTDGKKDRHWLPGQGIIDWAQFMKDLISIDYQGVLTLEISGSSEFTEKNVDNVLFRGIESMKNILKRCCFSGEDGLLNYSAYSKEAQEINITGGNS